MCVQNILRGDVRHLFLPAKRDEKKKYIYIALRSRNTPLTRPIHVFTGGRVRWRPELTGGNYRTTESYATRLLTSSVDLLVHLEINVRVVPVSPAENRSVRYERPTVIEKFE